jgi:hypothetical protein
LTARGWVGRQESRVRPFAHRRGADAEEVCGLAYALRLEIAVAFVVLTARSRMTLIWQSPGVRAWVALPCKRPCRFGGEVLPVMRAHVRPPARTGFVRSACDREPGRRFGARRRLKQSCWRGFPLESRPQEPRTALRPFCSAAGCGLRGVRGPGLLVLARTRSALSRPGGGSSSARTRGGDARSCGRWSCSRRPGTRS